MTVSAVVHGSRPAPVPMRWTWEDGERVWHATDAVPAGSGRHVLSWEGIFSVAGIHRLDLRTVGDERIGAAVLLLALGTQRPRIAVSGQVVRDASSAPHRLIPISAVVASADASAEQRSEVRWLDGESDVRSHQVSWVIDAPRGWVHLGGTVHGELGAVNQFRAHFEVVVRDAPAAERVEIRIYPPRANPGVDPPRRVISGPIQGFRSRGSIST